MGSKFGRLLLLLVALGALGAGGYYAKKNYLDPAQTTDAKTSAGGTRETGTGMGGVPTPGTSSTQAGGSIAMAPATPAPKAGLVDEPNFEVDAANIQARKDVLKRVEKMPHLTDEQKAKLTSSVGRARNMGCIFIIPFQSGQREIGQRETDLLVSGFKSPAIQQLMKDPTVVFVVLGYADKQGDPATNEKVSNDRTQSVLTAMRERCGVQNVSYGVGMGGSDMFDGKSAAKNRLVEIWAAFP